MLAVGKQKKRSRTQCPVCHSPGLLQGFSGKDMPPFISLGLPPDDELATHRAECYVQSMENVIQGIPVLKEWVRSTPDQAQS